MKEKISDIWFNVTIWWNEIFANVGIVIFVISVVGTAVVYKTNPNFDSSLIFILSIIGVVGGLALNIYCSWFTTGEATR